MSSPKLAIVEAGIELREVLRDCMDLRARTRLRLLKFIDAVLDDVLEEQPHYRERVELSRKEDHE